MCMYEATKTAEESEWVRKQDLELARWEVRTKEVERQNESQTQLY